MSEVNLNAAKIIGFSTASSSKPTNNVASEEKNTVTIKSDSLETNKKEIQKGSIPNSLNSDVNFQIGKHIFTSNVEEVPSGDLEYAKVCTDKNKIDEVFFKTLEDGKLYVVYGDHDQKGSLGDIDDLAPKRRGLFNGKVAEIVHVNNEINTISEGAKGPFVSMIGTLRDATESGIVKGVAEVGTTLTALYLGKALVANVQTAQTTLTAATEILQTAETASNVAQVAAESVVTAAKTMSASKRLVAPLLNEGRTILSTVRTSTVGFVKVGLSVTAVVGIVAAGMSVVGAVKGANPKNDYSTIVEITDPRLAVQKNK